MNRLESASEGRPAAYVFDDVRVERHNVRVLKGGQPRTIEPRAFDVLIFLIEHRGRVVEKQELFEQVWKQSFVTDSALAQEIKNIRQVIGDNAHSPRYIETVPKHGYRFIAEVTVVAPAPEIARGIKDTAPRSAIAVLPFVNLTGDSENDYFCDGLSEELISRLAKLKELRVVAQTSSFSFKGREPDVREIGRKLKAGTILEGSVRKIGDRLRISAQLINAADGYHMWAEAYDRRWDDPFSIQDEISLAIVDKLKVELFPGDRTALVKRYTENLKAYHLYLKGRYFWNKRSEPGVMQKAIDYFQQAICVDPRYALAYAGLADTYSILGVSAFRAPREVFPLAKAMVEKAFEIDSELAEAHTSLGIIHLANDYDCAAAERELKRALELNSGYVLAHQWYSYVLTVMGRMDEALARIGQAMELDPISPTVNAAAGRALCYARQYEASVEQLQKTIELDSHLGLAHFYLGQTYTLQGKYKEALAVFQKALEISGEFPWATSYIGHVYGLSGERDKAREIIHEWQQQRKMLPVPTAVIYLGLGEDDKVFEYLDRGYEERDFLMPWINAMPDFDRLRPDPRFQDLMRRIGLAFDG
ncbi:MAG TPA: tetratricopeptide repeat protein [Blastocatellia bacterium]